VSEAPFGVAEIVAAAGPAPSVLDAGCGSARLTLALARAGAREVVGVDTSAERLAQGRERLRTAGPAGDRVTLLEADFDAPLPFGDDRFGAAVSRLALMIASDPVATLGELGRVTRAGGRIVTALWAPPADNPWFALPRTAAATVLGAERATYARAFGRLGDPEQAAQAHRAAGLGDVRATTLRETLEVAGAAGHWAWLVRENGHVRRLDATLGEAERAAVLAELERLDAPYAGDGPLLRLPRTMTLVTARVTA
jgi:SAM-dependent methyltransferase